MEIPPIRRGGHRSDETGSHSRTRHQGGTSPLLHRSSSPVARRGSELQQIDALEDVIFVGYPELAYDQRNNLPVFRRGITATFPWIDYKGKPEFLIDASVFPGSSGSPVFIYNRPPWLNKYGQSQHEERLLLLGVLRAANCGERLFVSIPTPEGTPTQSIIGTEMIDLGVVIKTRSIEETIEHAVHN